MRFESVVGPPDCAANQQCHESCSAKAAAHPICTPPTVALICAQDVNEDTRKLIATINRNFSALWEVAETKGPIIAKAIEQLTVTGEAVANASGDLSGKNLACAKDATQDARSASITLKVITKSAQGVTAAAATRAY